jgi:hypothetical protein
MGFFSILKKLISPLPPKHYGRNLSLQDKEEIRRKWAGIEQLMRLGRPSGFKAAILDADKILDHALKLMGFQGQTMADRMKRIKRDDHEKDFFDDMWQAHITRNHMVHNMDYEVLDFEAKKAIKQFERVLRELGAL